MKAEFRRIRASVQGQVHGARQRVLGVGFHDAAPPSPPSPPSPCIFPRVDARMEVRAPLSIAPHGNARILVVDDEPLQLRTCRRVLSHFGYSVDTLSRGAEVIEVFHARMFALVSSV